MGAKGFLQIIGAVASMRDMTGIAEVIMFYQHE
jgi:hypothetical protein